RNCPIQQGLSDGAPDVDAVQRLLRIAPVDDIMFRSAKGNISFTANGPWTPFNSQVTTWHRSVFELMYLPVTCTFRVTDILRGYVALALLRSNETLTYVGSQAMQDRNPHNLMQDLASETPLHKQDWRAVIKDVAGSEDMSRRDRMWNVYEGLTRYGIVRDNELKYLYRWFRDLEDVR